MDKANNLEIDEHNILIALAGIISALCLKEVWSIIKQKIDIGAKKEERVENRQDIKQNVKEFAGKVGRGINPFDKGSRDWWADKPFSLKTPKVKGRRRGSGLY